VGRRYPDMKNTMNEEDGAGEKFPFSPLSLSRPNDPKDGRKGEKRAKSPDL
jgi:hypothetical protein